MNRVVLAFVAGALLLTADAPGPVAAATKGPVERISDIELVNYFGVTGKGGKPLTLVVRFKQGGWEDVTPGRPEHFRESGAVFGYRVGPEKPSCESFVVVDIRSLNGVAFEQFVERYVGTVTGRGSAAKIEDTGDLADEVRSRGGQLAEGPSAPVSYAPLKRFGARTTDFALARGDGLVDPVRQWLVPMDEQVLMFRVEDYGTNRNVSKLEKAFGIRKGAPPTNVDLPVKYDVVTTDQSHDEKVCGLLPKSLSLVRVFERKDYGEDVFGIWVSRGEAAGDVAHRLTLRVVDTGVNAVFEDYVAQHVESLGESLSEIEMQSGDGLFANVHGKWLRGVSGGGKIVYEVVTRNPVGAQPARFVQHWTLEISDPAAEEKTLKSFRKFVKSLHGWVRPG